MWPTPIRKYSTTFARKTTPVIPKPPIATTTSSSSTTRTSSSLPTLLASSSIGNNNTTNHQFSTTPTTRAPPATTQTTTITQTATQAIHKCTPIPQKLPTILRPITQPQCSNNSNNNNNYVLTTNVSRSPQPTPPTTMIKSINMKGIIAAAGVDGGGDGGVAESGNGCGVMYNSKRPMMAVTQTGNGGVKYNINNNNYAVNSFVDEFTDFVLNDRFADELTTTNNCSSHPPKLPTLKPTNTIRLTMKNCVRPTASRTIAAAQAGSSTIVRNANNTVITTTSSSSSSSSNNSNSKKTTTIQPRTVQLLVTRRPIIANNNNASSNSRVSGAQTATIVAPGVLKITSTPTHAHNNSNQSQILHTTSGAETVVIEEEDDELLTATSGDDGSMSPNALAMSATTAQILRKFRIPKGTALTAKSMSSVEVANSAPEALICSASTTPVHSPIHSTSCSPPPPADTPNSLDLVEEVIETDENSADEALITADTTTADTLNDCEAVDAVDEADDDDDVAAHTNHTATVLVPAGGSASGALTATTASALPQIQLQTVQPNGTVTCINLPPNTILLTAPDGSTILATATPQQLSKLTQQHQPPPPQQQIIAIQDWNAVGGGGAGVSSSSSSSVDANTGSTVLQAVQAAATHHQQQQQQQSATTTQTLLLTADGTAIPIIQSAPAANSSANGGSANSAAAAAAAAAQLVAAQQAEALKAQVLA